MTFWLLNGFVHRLPSAAFVDCSGIFEKAFSIAILIYPLTLRFETVRSSTKTS